MNAPDTAKSSITNLVSEVSRYFRDFLTSDFKKVRLPKRQIRLRGENRETLGINLRKYESFNRECWRRLSEPLDPKAKIKISRGQYKAPIPANLNTLINRQINGLTDDVFQEFIYRLLGASTLLCQRFEDIDEIIDGIFFPNINFGSICRSEPDVCCSKYRRKGRNVSLRSRFTV